MIGFNIDSEISLITSVIFIVRPLAFDEFVPWCVMGLELKHRTTGATSGGLKLQCIAIEIFSSSLLQPKNVSVSI